MKHAFYLLLLFVGLTHAQDNILNINVDNVNQTLQAGTPKTILTDKAEIKSFTIAYNLPTGYALNVSGPNNKSIPFTGGNAPVTFADNLLNNEVLLQLTNNGSPVIGKLWSFRLTAQPKVVPVPPNTGGVPASIDFDKYLYNIFRNTDFSVDGNRITPFGIVDKEGRIHIYIDYRGNNLMTTIPSGISNAQYVVHVITPYNSQEPSPTTYTIKQKSGSFSDALNFRNAGSIGSYKEHGAKNYDEVRDEKFVLATSTDNLSFDLVAVNDENSTITKTVIDSYTIKMTPTYHGSFDVGFLQTTLTNPEYSLVNSPDGTYKTVKKTSKGNREGVATVMATFYYSPIIMLESLLGKQKVPSYKLNGRNFLDDHKFYERIYPTVGVGLSDKVFENFFVGFNWEVVRGFAVFYGWNYRKVNTFSMPGYVDGVTPVTQDQFNYYTNEDWKTKPSYGIKMDLLVVAGLFGK